MSGATYDPATDPLHPYLFAGVSDLPIAPQHIATRCQHVMANDNICYIGDVVWLTEAEWLRIPNFGLGCLNALKIALRQLGLRPGMVVPEWPPSPERLEEVRRQCVERGLWDFQKLPVQQAYAHDAAYAETIDALHALRREINIIREHAERLRYQASANYKKRAAAYRALKDADEAAAKTEEAA